MGQLLWFVSRSTGLVTLLLLTATVVLGATHSGRDRVAGWPRFALHAVHRNLSLLALLFVTVHAGSAVLDPYVELAFVDAVVPFGSAYDPLWTGLGALAFDLMLAVLLTSLLRGRISPARWRAVHLGSYAMWPLALAHGIGSGAVDSAAMWVLALRVGCAAAVSAALARRLLPRRPDRSGVPT